MLGISICFSLWTAINLITLTNIHSTVILFSWSFVGLLQSLISILSIYFIYVFLYKRDISYTLKLIFFIILSPLLLLSHTTLNLNGLDITACDAFQYEGPIFLTYYNALGLIAMMWIFILLMREYRIATVNIKKQILLMGIGIEFFLFTFFLIVFLAGYLTEQGILEDSRLEMYGLFGMIVFMTFISVLIVKFKAFKTELAGAQALVVTLWFLVGSLLFVAKSSTTQIVSGITLLITTVAGFNLVQSVKKEIQQREQIEKLAFDLSRANERLKELDKMKSEFVSIASHQLRSPITSIRGYASMLVEGSYGKIPDQATEILNKIVESSKYMALSIEDYLNVSRIEAGNMKYEYSDFDVKKLAETVADELRPVAIKKGLVLLFKNETTGSTTVHADIGKTKQVIMNLVDNSIKYTPKGTVNVIARNDIKKKVMQIRIEDTGVGMSKETIEGLFDKFVRAKNANNVNVTGTGLGLYVAKTMVTQMKGRVWAESDGEGKGSRFIIEFPTI